MAERESFRTITTKSTIPAGTAATGGFSTHPTDTSRLIVGFGNIAEFATFRNKGYGNIWVYAVGSHKIAQVKNVLQISAADTTNYHIFVDRAMAGITFEAFTIIVGDLLEWTAVNKGGGTGYISSEPIINGQVVNSTYKNFNSGVTSEKDVEIINGIGTSFTVIETR